MAEGESPLPTRDVERGTTPPGEPKQKTKITLSNEEIKEILKPFNDCVDSLTPGNKPAKLEEFKRILTDAKLEKMKTFYKQEEENLKNVTTHLPEQKSFLNRFSLQEVLVRMVNDIAKYAEFLKLFIEHFKAYNECIEAKYQPKDKPKKQRSPIFNNDPRTMRDLDAPLHFAVRQLNEGFIEWLLKQSETDVNLRNKQRQTPLAILCVMYDWYMETMPKLKLRIEEIKKERETADKMQQIWLDEEEIEVSAQKEELEMNAPTILKLIKRLLEKGADFNIYMNVGALPFDFLRKYDTEADVAEIINSQIKSNVAMTENPSKQLNADAEGKIKSKNRIVEFYKKSKDKDDHVTVELLEIFICFNDLEKFKHYWENFEVTGDNVKKVITLLLHVAVERNYTNYVKLIIEKASDEIFKVEQNKAKDTQVTRSVPPGRRHTKVTRSVPPGRRHTLWCCFTDPCLSMSAEDFSGWCCFGKCCRNRHSTDLQTQEELIELGETYAITSERTPMNAEATDSQTQSGTFTPEGTVPQTQSETVESQHNIPASQENIPDSQDNRAFTSETNTVPVEIHQPDSQTQSQTNGLQDNIPGSQDNAVVMSETTPITDEIHNPDSQTPNETSELLASGPQENYPGRTEGTSPSVTSSSRWWCLKCCQQEQNPSFHEETDTHEQRPNSKPKDGRMVHRTELKGLLKKVCLNGNKALLSFFLKKMDDRLLVNENPLLINTLNGAYTMKQKKESAFLLECAKILINNHSKVDMYRVDMNGNTALHLALSYGYENLALLMLKHGNGLMRFMNNQNFTPIDYGRRQFWEDYLDNCITAGDRTELKLNVNFLQPLAKKEPTESKPKVSCYGSWLSCFKFFKPMKELHNSKYHFARTVNDMTALRLISLSKDRKEFLMHPVIVAFIIMKWERLCHWNILNFLLTTITMFTFAGYTLLSPGTLKDVTMGFVILLASILLVREIMQWWFRRWSYFTLENGVDLINLLLIGIVLGCGSERDGVCKLSSMCSSFVVVSLSLQATFLLGASWNNLSITLYMFKTVSSSFFSSFLCFTPVIGAFIYSFYRTNNEPSNNPVTYYSEEDSQNKSSEKNFNNFHSVWDASIKTLVMTTGEFEAANIDFDGGKWLLFVAFLFIAPIVILNLINGLAVSDIAAIRQESEFISICRKVQLIERYERAVINYGHTISGCLQRFFRDPWFPGPFFQEHESIIYIKTNELNQLKIQKKKREPRLIPGFFVRLCRCKKDRYFGFRSYEKSLFATLDQSYVDKAMAIASKRFTIITDEETNPSTAGTRDTGNNTLQRLISKNSGVELRTQSFRKVALSVTNSEDQYRVK